MNPLSILSMWTLLATPAMAQHGHGDEKDTKGEIRLYLADRKKEAVDLKDVTATIQVEFKGGARKTLKTEVVEPRGGRKLGLGHGGEVKEMDGYYVEFVVREPQGHEKHHDDKHHGEEGEEGGEEHGKEEDATAYFKADVDLTGFSAVVIFRIKGETKNVKGFEYPPAMPATYADAVAKIEQHLKEIEELIRSNGLEAVHAVAEKISQVCEKLGPLAPEDDRPEVEKTCKEIVALFEEIDEAADAGKKDETTQVYKKYVEKVASLKKHAGEHHR